MVLRTATGLVVDSLNYGLLVDPWAAEGNHSVSGADQAGCRVPAPSVTAGGGPFAPPTPVNTPHRSAGRTTDGADTDSNCTDFQLQAAAVLPAAAKAGASSITIDNTVGFVIGQTVSIGDGSDAESAIVAAVGTPGATTSNVPVVAGATAIPVGSVTGFVVGQAITVGTGTETETATVTAIGRTFGPGGPGGPRRGGTLTLAAPLARGYTADTPVTGTGLTLSAPLTKSHGAGTHVGASVPTPGAPNNYSKPAARR